MISERTITLVTLSTMLAGAGLIALCFVHEGWKRFKAWRRRREALWLNQFKPGCFQTTFNDESRDEVHQPQEWNQDWFNGDSNG
jgi:hypothetical protein